jgi:uncharacterized protein HemY
MTILLSSLLTLLAFFSFTEQANALDFTVPESAFTQTTQKNSPNKQANNPTPRLSEIAYRQLQPIQQQISAEKYDQALNSLTQLAKRYQNKPYVVSIAMNSAAYIYIAQESYSKAMTWMKRTLALSAMSTAELQTIRHDLSQLQLQAEEYQNAANTMNEWLKVAKPAAISIADYQFIAIAELHLEHYKKSKQAAQKGLLLTKQSPDKQPQNKQISEPLYRLILSSELALKQYQSAIKTASKLVKLSPNKKNYWQQLSGIHDVLEQPKQALAVFELMDQRNMLNSELERVQYIQRLIHQNNSFKAANKLSQYMQTSEVKDTEDNRLLLADAWERSGESQNAIKLLIHLPPEQTTSRLVRIYTREQNWKKLAELIAPQFKAPINKTNESLFMQLGYAFHQLEQFEKATKVFSKLANAKDISKETKKSANEWLTYLEAQ